jgi:hypothetical protein
MECVNEYSYLIYAIISMEYGKSNAKTVCDNAIIAFVILCVRYRMIIIIKSDIG